MNRSRIKTIIKIALWSYIIITVAPDAVTKIVECIGDITGEGIKWVGAKLWEGMLERGTVHGADENKVIGGIFGQLFQSDPLPTQPDTVLPGNAKINEVLNKLLHGGK